MEGRHKRVHSGAGIICDTVNRRKLERIEGKIDALRSRGGVNASELWPILTALGRSQKGKLWRSEAFPQFYPITVHDHPRDLNRYTKDGILDDMEKDVRAWESSMDAIGEGDGDDGND
jgi:hypothetical protein